MMTGSENRGEKQPGKVPLQTGPGRDAIAKSVMKCIFPAGLKRGNNCKQHTGLQPCSQCFALFRMVLLTITRLSEAGHPAVRRSNGTFGNGSRSYGRSRSHESQPARERQSQQPEFSPHERHLRIFASILVLMGAGLLSVRGETAHR